MMGGFTAQLSAAEKGGGTSRWGFLLVRSDDRTRSHLRLETQQALSTLGLAWRGGRASVT